MISAEGIRQKALRKFTALCRAWITGEKIYPMPIRINLKPPGETESALLNGWKNLYEASKNATGKRGYVLEFKTVQTRLRGAQSQPSRLLLPSREDHLSLIGKTSAFHTFQADVQSIRSLIADESWLVNNISLILRYPGDWDNIVQVLAYLAQHPEAALSLREIPIADSKFTEKRRPAVLTLAAALSENLQHTLTRLWGGPSAWRPTMRFLHPSMRPCGLSRISIELSEMPLLLKTLNPQGLLIVENRTSFDKLPEIPGFLALWGEGNSVQALAEVNISKALPLFYWGDMDREGLAILARLRQFLPHTQSVAMNRKTFEAYKQYTVPDTTAVELPAKGLTKDEQALYRILDQSDSASLRLEQERIPPSYAVESIKRRLE